MVWSIFKTVVVYMRTQSTLMYVCINLQLHINIPYIQTHVQHILYLTLDCPMHCFNIIIITRLLYTVGRPFSSRFNFSIYTMTKFYICHCRCRCCCCCCVVLVVLIFLFFFPHSFSFIHLFVCAHVHFSCKTCITYTLAVGAFG